MNQQKAKKKRKIRKYMNTSTDTLYKKTLKCQINVLKVP